MLKAAGVRSTQRLALGEVGGGIVALTWPAELVAQAHYSTRASVPRSSSKQPRPGNGRCT